MTKSTETLADYVGRIRRERGLSLADVERQSARGGQKIAGGYVNRIENGLAKRVSPDRLQALARGLGVPVDGLWAVVSGQAPGEANKADEARLLAMFRELPAGRRKDVLRILETLHSEHATSHDSRVA
jgi:Helix-turn-helix.